MEEIKEKFLPIGTVVMLKGGRKRLMITGFCSVGDENKEKVYDYSGCLYPEGYLSSNQVCLFDHEQIEKVYHMGLVDEEESSFKVKLEGYLKGLDKNSKGNVKEEIKENIDLDLETNASVENLDDDFF